MSDYDSSPSGGPRRGQSGRSPALARAGREPRAQSDATSAASGRWDPGDGLMVRDGVLHVAPARDPGAHVVKGGSSDSARIAALEAYVNLLRSELAAAKLLGR